MKRLSLHLNDDNFPCFIVLLFEGLDMKISFSITKMSENNRNEIIAVKNSN